jgi:hypothetical protein
LAGAWCQGAWRACCATSDASQEGGRRTEEPRRKFPDSARKGLAWIAFFRQYKESNDGLRLRGATDKSPAKWPESAGSAEAGSPARKEVVLWNMRVPASEVVSVGGSRRAANRPATFSLVGSTVDYAPVTRERARPPHGAPGLRFFRRPFIGAPKCPNRGRNGNRDRPSGATVWR